jgi:hypothetical protein
MDLTFNTAGVILIKKFLSALALFGYSIRLLAIVLIGWDVDCDISEFKIG